MKNVRKSPFFAFFFILCLAVAWCGCENDDDDDDGGSTGGDDDKQPMAKFCNQILWTDGLSTSITLVVGDVTFSNVKTWTCSSCQEVPTGSNQITVTLDDDNYDLGSVTLPTYQEYPEYTFINAVMNEEVIVELFGYDCDMNPFED